MLAQGRIIYKILCVITCWQGTTLNQLTVLNLLLTSIQLTVLIEYLTALLECTILILIWDGPTYIWLYATAYLQWLFKHLFCQEWDDSALCESDVLAKLNFDHDDDKLMRGQQGKLLVKI